MDMVAKAAVKVRTSPWYKKAWEEKWGEAAKEEL